MFRPRLPRSIGRLCLARPSIARLPRHDLQISPEVRVRYMATPPPQVSTNNDITQEQYHQLSDEAMDVLVERLEHILDESPNEAYEVDYSSGVLTLNLGHHGTYVINKQPPNKQIWLSSPLSGPKRYDYCISDGSWRYSRDDSSLADLLNEELRDAFEEPPAIVLKRD